MKHFNLAFLAVILITLLIRLNLSFLPAFEIDQSAYRYFSARLISHGFDKFYLPDGFNLNALGYLYVIWVISKFKEIIFPGMNFFSTSYDILLKIPANLADIVIGTVLYALVKNKIGKKWAIFAFLIYVLNPAIFFNSAIWGQYDSVATLFLLLASLAIIYKKSANSMALLFAIACTIKPQAIFFSPIAILLVLKTAKPIQWLTSSIIFLTIVIVVYLPFFPKNPIHGLYQVNFGLAKSYTCTSCFAFNFWGIFGNWQNDLNPFLGVAKFYWGVVLLAFFWILLSLTKLIKSKLRSPDVFLIIALSSLSSFMLLTRIHERYLASFFPFFLLAAVFLKSRILIVLYFFISLLHFLNLYYVYIYYNVFYSHLTNPFTNNLLYAFLSKNYQSLSFFSTLIFIFLTFINFRGLKSRGFL